MLRPMKTFCARIIVLGLLVFSIAWAKPKISGVPFSVCSNGIYLDPDPWIKTDRTDAELETLSLRLLASSMDRVYIYANPLKNPDDLPRFQKLSLALKKNQPGLKIFGFIGIRVRGGVYPDPTNRARTVASLGFDGIQVDYEPTPLSGDPKYLQVFDLIRAAAPGLPVSVAAYWLQPDQTLAASSHPVAPAGLEILEWDSTFYSQVLAKADDVMVMNYDTTLKVPQDYADFTTWQYDHILALSKKEKARVSIGLPTPDVWGRTGLFDRKAENYKVGMEALRTRLAKGTCPDGIGVTLYDDTGMKDEDWTFFQQYLTN